MLPSDGKSPAKPFLKRREDSVAACTITATLATLWARFAVFSLSDVEKARELAPYILGFCCGKSSLAGLSPFALRKLRELTAAFAE